MERVLAMMMLGGALCSQAPVTTVQSAQSTISTSALAAHGSSAGSTPDMPPLPRGKSTVLGGSIRDVDPVRDQLVLDVYGQKPMKVLFDERTEVYRDGKKISLREFGPASHASIQTTLDGAKIFAVSVHILTQQPNGEYRGRVLSFNSETGALMLSSTSRREPFRVVVTNQTSFQRVGQAAFSSAQSGTTDLVPGSLVEVRFTGDNKGKGVAQEVSVLAAPGGTFIFSGDLTSLDMHTGALVVVDPRTNENYQVFFDPTREPAQKLRAGQHVRISADYDGKRYVATEITVD